MGVMTGFCWTELRDACLLGNPCVMLREGQSADPFSFELWLTRRGTVDPPPFRHVMFGTGVEL